MQGRTNIRLKVMIAGFLFVCAVSGYLVAQATLRSLLRIEAETASEGITKYLAANLPDVAAIAAGQSPSPESRRFLERSRLLDNVFLYKIYDAEGKLKLRSDRLETGAGEGLNVHNPEASEAIQSGAAMASLERGDGVSRPDYYAEAYVPVVVDGRVVAVVEADMDQTAKHANIFDRVTGALAGLVATILLAGGLPAIALYRRTRQKQQADEEVLFLSGHDPMTGLLNRPHFISVVDEWMRSGRPIAVCRIGLDRFAALTDAIGQRNGDEVLKQIAERLASVLGPGPIIARIGGDEFAVALPSIGSEADAESGARQAIAAFTAPFRVAGRQAPVSASVGLAISDPNTADAVELMKNAGTARRSARASGGGHYKLFRREMDRELSDRQVIEALIGRALAEERLELYFQPFFRCADRRLLGFETLLRLSSDDGTPIPPSRFIPIAEAMGAIGQIGEYVLRKACGIAAEWPPEITVSVNLSPVQFGNGTLCRTVQAVLEESGLAPRRLELEITEGLLLHNTESVLSQLRSLKALGVSIAMDDFGTGYSSLSYLWKFSFDKLKIDRSFMRALEQDEANVAFILRAIVSLGKSLRMDVTAEGVESEAQALFLSNLSCDSLQGLHLGEPMPATEIPAVILGDFKRMVADLRQQIRTASGDEPMRRSA